MRETQAEIVLIKGRLNVKNVLDNGLSKAEGHISQEGTGQELLH